jgi:hypothetical protein
MEAPCKKKNLEKFLGGKKLGGKFEFFFEVGQVHGTGPARPWGVGTHVGTCRQGRCAVLGHKNTKSVNRKKKEKNGREQG